MAQNNPLYEQIYDLVRQIPVGQVATYGQIAALLGRPRNARQVGYALFRVAPDADVPWHRVVNAKGEISQSPQRQGSDDLQRILLEQEDVIFNTTDRINLRQYQWEAKLMPLNAPHLQK
ncbi:DNA base-flipping protein [Acaryochloris thomasi RCC1774]|uniref:DNA base-flipping protein n=1 Tax=Acaryochloris thomasi RCC1774 TaxID=1764569 RepID=A0A2W1JFA5_9CYAN|nr:methylated-DNA--[protein]-cysteine S-methyltransferase [Acaryochloris thomasi]PZD72146.1 DNA base-flipping protein [Acaryochloris thomasi RCC1774]